MYHSHDSIYGNICINVPVKSSLYKWTLGEKKYTSTSWSMAKCIKVKLILSEQIHPARKQFSWLHAYIFRPDVCVSNQTIINNHMYISVVKSLKTKVLSPHICRNLIILTFSCFSGICHDMDLAIMPRQNLLREQKIKK